MMSSLHDLIANPRDGIIANQIVDEKKMMQEYNTVVDGRSRLAIDSGEQCSPCFAISYY
jgi:hypothetical protein